MFIGSDLLDPILGILSTEDIEKMRGIELNSLEYMAIKTRVTKCIQNANKTTLRMGSHRPEMLNLVFTPQNGCQDIYRQPGEYEITNLKGNFRYMAGEFGKRVRCR